MSKKMSKDVKKMSNCQKDVKCQTPELWRKFTKKKIDTMRFTYIDVNFHITYEGHQNWSKILSTDILSIFGHHDM